MAAHLTRKSHSPWPGSDLPADEERDSTSHGVYLALTRFDSPAAAGESTRSALLTKDDTPSAAPAAPVSAALSLPTDWLLAQQWHLGNTGGLLDLNVRGVWNPATGDAYTGAGTRTFVIDDGFDYRHPDLAPNYNLSLDYDYQSKTNDAFGSASDAHGTAVAGIIGADNNGTGAVGVAFDTEFVGYRVTTSYGNTFLTDTASAIQSAAVHGADVTNISLGIANDARSWFGFGYNPANFDSIEYSIGRSVDLGRSGLGTTIVKGAGNSRMNNYDVNADDWTNDTRGVVVAAVDQNGFVSSYSSYGAPVLVSAFGTPGQVVTTDRLGAAGFSSTDFTTFNGTSAAAPMVTGIVALMLDANPNLGWRDVQSILANSARHVGSAIGGGVAGAERFLWGFNDANTWNGGGLHFSNDYGYGLVDALAAVRLSETWLLGGGVAQRTANQYTNTVDLLHTATLVPDNNAAGLTFGGRAPYDDAVDRVTIKVDFSTTYLGDLELYVTSPGGTVSKLIDDTGGGGDFNGSWTFETQAFRGERAAGTWSVRIVDDAPLDRLMVSNIVLTTFGNYSYDDRYVFTNEYATYGGLAGRNVIVDTNGGIDTLNAAAVTGNAAITLVPGAISAIAGRTLTIAAGTTIENAIGGDGHDAISGNNSSNQLFGGRGNDTLNGGGGVDRLYGDAGDDVIVDANQAFPGDVFDGGSGTDTLIADFAWADDVQYDLASGWMKLSGFGGPINDTILDIENLTIGGGADVIGSSAANVITVRETGSVHNNVIDAGGGNDIVFAGSGNDAIDSGGGVDAIYAGPGDDTITDGNWYFAGDIFDGGAGVDTLIVRFDWFDGVQYNLASGWMRYPGPGGTTFDTILNIENLVVGGGADVIGSSAANVITILDLGIDHDNVIDAGDGNDIVFAGIGNDTVNGGVGDDTLDGGAGMDVIRGGAGIDVLTGNAGDDDFVYTSTVDSNEATGLDSIVALEAGDQLDLSALLLATDKTSILDRGNVAYLGSTLDFFNDGGIDRAVAVQTDGVTTRAYADSNGDGNYTIGLDLAIQFTGNVLPALTSTSDYIF